MKVPNGCQLPMGTVASWIGRLALAALCACGQSSWGSPDAGSSGGSAVGPSAIGPDGGALSPVGAPPGSTTGCGLLCGIDAATGTPFSAEAGIPVPVLTSVDGGVPYSDCPGCTFPPLTATPCAASAPPINLVYPADTVLLPPNLNIISVQWTPFSPLYKNFEVDFSQTTGTTTTDWRIVTACTTQTTDMQAAGAPSGGCEVTLDPASWAALVTANRGSGNPISITVRGTTDGTCATTSMNTVHVSIAQEDLVGAYYYWKSTVSATGTGGQIWAKGFGDLTAEVDVSTAAIPNATCNGCHSLSRDGSRMVIYSDDDDSDDEYNDVAGSYLDMTPLFANPATEFPGGITGVRQGGQPPGFSTINPVATYYVTSNGAPCTAAAAGGGGRGGGRGGASACTAAYTAAVPNNGFSVWNGTNGAFIGGAAIGAVGQRPTMPDWSIDGNTVVYVQPAGEFATWKTDDAHIYGGSLYTVPYMGNGMFGATATVLLQSAGENNYYPSFSPDTTGMTGSPSFVIFNRVDNMKAGATCTGTMAAAGACLDDSFSNPAARLMLMGATAAGGMPIDLEKANGSPASAKMPLSNSYPRWAPFVQTYQGNKILWFTFSSTRNYGLRILNQKTGVHQCYPADSAEWPGGAHGGKFDTTCQEPQLWMAPVTFTAGQLPTVDPSGVAFWLPYQDMTTHNHTAQWTWKPNATACTCSMVYGACGAANGGCGCCTGQGLVCTGSGQCIRPPN